MNEQARPGAVPPSLVGPRRGPRRIGGPESTSATSSRASQRELKR